MQIPVVSYFQHVILLIKTFKIEQLIVSDLAHQKKKLNVIIIEAKNITCPALPPVINILTVIVNVKKVYAALSKSGSLTPVINLFTTRYIAKAIKGL